MSFRAFRICRATNTDGSFDPQAKFVFEPSIDSDELFDALRLEYPFLKTHGERKQRAVLDFLVLERAEDMIALDALVTNEFSASPTVLTSVDSMHTPAESSTAFTPESSGTVPQPSPIDVAPSAMFKSKSTSSSAFQVWDPSSDRPVKLHSRRRMTDQEKEEYRMRRLLGSCDLCKQKRRKCRHLSQATAPASKQKQKKARVSKAASSNASPLFQLMSASESGSDSSPSESLTQSFNFAAFNIAQPETLFTGDMFPMADMSFDHTFGMDFTLFADADATADWLPLMDQQSFADPQSADISGPVNNQFNFANTQHYSPAFDANADWLSSPVDTQIGRSSHDNHITAMVQAGGVLGKSTLPQSQHFTPDDHDLESISPTSSRSFSGDDNRLASISTTSSQQYMSDGFDNESISPTSSHQWTRNDSGGELVSRSSSQQFAEDYYDPQLVAGMSQRITSREPLHLNIPNVQSGGLFAQGSVNDLDITYTLPDHTSRVETTHGTRREALPDTQSVPGTTARPQSARPSLSYRSENVQRRATNSAIEGGFSHIERVNSDRQLISPPSHQQCQGQDTSAAGTKISRRASGPLHRSSRSTGLLQPSPASVPGTSEAHVTEPHRLKAQRKSLLIQPRPNEQYRGSRYATVLRSSSTTVQLPSSSMVPISAAATAATMKNKKKKATKPPSSPSAHGMKTSESKSSLPSTTVLSVTVKEENGGNTLLSRPRSSPSPSQALCMHSSTMSAIATADRLLAAPSELSLSANAASGDVGVNLNGPTWVSALLALMVLFIWFASANKVSSSVFASLSGSSGVYGISSGPSLLGRKKTKLAFSGFGSVLMSFQCLNKGME